MNEYEGEYEITIRVDPITVNMLVIEAQTWIPEEILPNSATQRVITKMRQAQARAKAFAADPQRKEFADKVEAELAQRDRELLASIYQDEPQPPRRRTWTDRIVSWLGYRVIG